MEIDILNIISQASINGYYDPSLDLIVVWFYNIDNRSDLVAYLLSDMSWDLREIVDEKSSLYDNKEIVEIIHKPIKKFEKNSVFDKTIRKVLGQIIEHIPEEDENKSLELKMMKTILNNNNYTQN